MCGPLHVGVMLPPLAVVAGERQKEKRWPFVHESVCVVVCQYIRLFVCAKNAAGLRKTKNPHPRRLSRHARNNRAGIQKDEIVVNKRERERKISAQRL